MPRARPPPCSPSSSSSSSRSRSPSRSPSPTTARNPTSTLVHHTIPPFYACYLLRSFAARPGRGGLTYIGSTPDPPRRWRQHMGVVKGGAFKTRLGRPWEMECVVSGFPTKLQALQFEWAWQNPQSSRLLRAPVAPAPAPPPAAAAAAGGEDGVVANKGKGKAKAPAAPAPVAAQFPRTPLSNRPLSKVQVLQFMLTAAPWRAFPLRVTLLSLDARAWWDAARRLGPVVRTEAGARRFEREREREGAGADADAWGDRGPRLDEVVVEVRREGVDGARLVRAGERSEGDEVERMRVDDGEFFDAHWAKWTALVDDADALRRRGAKCELCRCDVDLSDHLAFHLCTANDPAALAPCLAVFHPACLASHLLSPSSSCTASSSTRPAFPPPATSSAPPAILAPPLLPTTGACPACGGAVHWAELVRGSYRRRDEAAGRRKKPTKQRAAAAGGRAVEGEGEGEGGVRSAAKGKGRGRGRSKGKGKCKAAQQDGASDDEELARFRFEGSGSDDPSSGAESVELDARDDDESDAERSFARLDAAAQEALEEGDEVRALWDDDDDDGSEVRGSEPAGGAPRARSTRLDGERSQPVPAPAASPSPSPPPAKKRGRPPKARPAPAPAPAPAPYSEPGDLPLNLGLGPLGPARSPWDDVLDSPPPPPPAPARKARAPRLPAVAAPAPASASAGAPAALPKKRGRPPKAAAAPGSLVGAASGFGATKAALSSRRAEASGGKSGSGALEADEDEREGGRGRERDEGLGAAQRRAKKRQAYIELSD